jgi:hypothetical protein
MVQRDRTYENVDACCPSGYNFVVSRSTWSMFSATRRADQGLCYSSIVDSTEAVVFDADATMAANASKSLGMLYAGAAYALPIEVHWQYTQRQEFSLSTPEIVGIAIAGTFTLFMTFTLILWLLWKRKHARREKAQEEAKVESALDWKKAELPALAVEIYELSDTSTHEMSETSDRREELPERSERLELDSSTVYEMSSPEVTPTEKKEKRLDV